ncbi:SLAM family member 8-like [Podarcis muralis]
MNFVILLSFGLLIFSSLETISHAVGNPTHQVKGILGGSVLFPANVSQGMTVEKIQWDFLPQRGGLGFWLGEFSHGKLEHPSPTDRFGQRLDMVNKTTLRLKDLELDDSGFYNARIWFTKALFQEQHFSLTVCEPVPTPQIDHQLESKTPGGCNVTLRCHTPGRGDLSISWETGGPHRALGKSVNQYQVSDNGRELRVSFWNSSLDSKFTCLVSNPVDQKRASFNLLNICQSDEGGQFGPLSWSPWLITALISLLVMMVMVMVMWMHWKIIFKTPRRGRTISIDLLPILLEMGASCQIYLFLSFAYPERQRLVSATDSIMCFMLHSTGVCSLMPEKGESSLTFWNPKDGDNEIQHCILQINMGDQAHLLEPLPRNSLKVPQGKDPLKISQSCQLSRSYSLPSTFKHSSQESRDQAKRQHTNTYPVTVDGVFLGARNLRNAFMTSISKSV